MILSLVAPWFDKPPKDLQFKKRKGGSVSFVCAAQGFPLEIEWLVEKIEGDKVFPATCISKSSEFILKFNFFAGNLLRRTGQ